MTNDERFEKWKNDNYKSPIEIYFDHFVTEVTKDIEGQIIAKARQVCDINIDKDELIKALRYDREQYSRGYANGFEQGYKAAKEELSTIIYEAINGATDKALKPDEEGEF